MALQTSHKWIILTIALIALGVIGYFIYKAIPKATTPGSGPGSTTTTTPGILDTVTNAFCKAFPKSKFCGGPGQGTYETVACDPNRPGYNIDGLYDNNCQ